MQPSYVHLKGFSPVWLRMWACILPECEKRFPQPFHVQGKGRTPVWIRLCADSVLGSEKLLPQPGCLQAKGRSPVWVRECMRSLLLCENRLSQPSKGQANGRSVCTHMCSTMSWEEKNQVAQPGFLQTHAPSGGEPMPDVGPVGGMAACARWYHGGDALVRYARGRERGRAVV